MIKIINKLPILCDEIPGGDLYELLELGKRLGVLINTHHMRGIGKTTTLIKFAKDNNYMAIVPNISIAQEFRKQYNYQKIFGNSISVNKGVTNKNIVLDEGVNNIKEWQDAGFNVITGFYTYNEVQQMFNEKVLNTLVNEIESLTPKIKTYRNNNDFGTYKNLINAYKEVLELIQRYNYENK